MVLGPFAETKGPRRGAETPQNPPPSARGAETPQTLPSRRAGPKPRILHVPFLSSSTIVIENPVSVALRTKEKEKALDPRSGSGMTDKRRKTAREGADVGQKARTEVRRPARATRSYNSLMRATIRLAVPRLRPKIHLMRSTFAASMRAIVSWRKASMLALVVSMSALVP